MWMRENKKSENKQEPKQNSDKRLAGENVACEKGFPLPLKVLYIT